MADTRSKEQRRRIMQAVGYKDTGPEMTVRRILHRLGYRYRLHRKELPGNPDIVFPAREKAILVHGCFWHGHGCRYGQPPKSRHDYWLPKLEQNMERDAKNIRALESLGWETLTVWQCEAKNIDSLTKELVGFLENGNSSRSISSVAD